MTPVPAFAKSALNDVRNSIFQRLADVLRRDGTDTYAQAMEGNNGGVDNKGSSMQSYMGIEVLTELLVMGRVGVYVDNPVVSGLGSLADIGDNIRPYLYTYTAEDILACQAGRSGELQSAPLAGSRSGLSHRIPIWHLDADWYV